MRNLQKDKLIFENKVVEVHVKPNAGRNELSFDAEKNVYVAFVKVPAEDGKANAEVLRLIKKESGLAGRIISGATSRKKLIKLN